MSDQHRRDSAGCYGHTLVRTPNIDRLAADGVRFSQAYCPSPLCGPCRSAVMTGRDPHHCGARSHRDMRRDMCLPTLGTVFRDAGYATGAFGKVHVAGETDENDLGFDERALRIYTPTRTDYQHTIGREAFWEYASYLPAYRPSPDAEPRNTYNPRNAPIQLDESLILDSMVADRSADFLARHRNDPFFLWIGFEKPHQEWYAPARYHEMYDPQAIALPDDIWQDHADLPRTIGANPSFPVVTREAYTDAELRCCIAAYYANITYMDEQLGRVLQAIDRENLAANTIVVYCSDHGENLFQHGLVHKHCFYEPAVAVPLVLRLPHHSGGATRDQLVSLVDLFPTLTEACGIRPPGELDGVSLLDACRRSHAPVRDAVYSEFHEWGVPERMIRTPRWKYIYTEGDRDQLYDVKADPLEHSNLAAKPEYAELCSDLRGRLLENWPQPPAAPGTA